MTHMDQRFGYDFTQSSNFNKRFINRDCNLNKLCPNYIACSWQTLARILKDKIFTSSLQRIEKKEYYN